MGMINTISIQIISKPNVLELFSKALSADSIQKNEIRDSLYNLLLPTYEQLKIAGIRQFIFIMPDNKVFIRFHRLEKYGDDLSDVRYSVKTANVTRQKQTGFEEGKTYNGFRNVFPISYNNEHIGIIEISFSFDIWQLLKQDGEVYGLMIKKDIIDSKLSASQKSNYVTSFLSDDYMHEKIFLHYDRDTLNILEQIDKSINTEIAEKLDHNESFTIHHQINKTDYLISFISTTNVEGKPAAYMFSYQKDDKVMAGFQQQNITKHVATSILYAILIFVILLIFLKKGKIKEIDDEYKKILDANTDIVFMLDSLGKQLYFNKQIETLLGYNQKELIGESFTKFVPKSELPKYLKKLKEVFLKKRISHFETLALHKDGSLIPVEITGRIIKYQGEIVGVGTIRSIEKRKKAEEEIRKLSAAVEQSANTIVITDVEGNIEYTNKKFTELTGYTAKEALGQNPRILKAGTQTDQYYKEMWETISSGKIWKGEFNNKKKDGGYFWEQVTITPLKNDKGEITNYLAIKEDFTARREAEQTLKVNEEKQKKILDSFVDGIYICTPDYKISYANSALQKKLGKDLVGKSCYKAIYNLDEKCSWCIYDKLNQKERIEYELQKEDDTILLINNTLLEGEDKITVLKDITTRKKAEQALKESEAKLKESNKTKDKFFSIIAHDLKSPFNSMLGFSELLSKNFDQFSTEEQKEFSDIIYKSVKSTHKLLENLLTWSSSQSGIIDFKPETINLLLLSTEIVQLLNHSAKNKAINITNHISGIIDIEADKEMLSTIIRNLISNAIKFTSHDGEISIVANEITDIKNQKFIEIGIKDTGVGISKEMQQKLFDISESTSTKGTENETGSGLGLILCKEFVEKHGGEIWVESEVGEGSTFLFRIGVG